MVIKESEGNYSPRNRFFKWKGRLFYHAKSMFQETPILVMELRIECQNRVIFGYVWTIVIYCMMLRKMKRVYFDQSC